MRSAKRGGREVGRIFNLYFIMNIFNFNILFQLLNINVLPGTGLLSMMAAVEGVDSIVACEEFR